MRDPNDDQQITVGVVLAAVGCVMWLYGALYIASYTVWGGL